MSARNIEAIYPLSPLQQGMLFHTLCAPAEAAVYFGQFHCTLQGDVNVDAIKWAWQRAVDQHPILRTAVVWENLDEPLQVVGRQVKLSFIEQDWRGTSPLAQQERLEQFLQADRSKGFDLTHAPVMRLILIRLADDAYHFIWSRPLMLLDGWSVALLLNEIAAFYDAFREGRQISPGPSRPYADYIAWLQQQDLSQAEAFWRRTLKGFTAPTPFGVDHPVDAGSDPDGEVFCAEQTQFTIATTEALQSLARRERLTLNVIVQGAWALLLSRYSGCDDVVFGATVSGRPPQLEGVDAMLGLFINTVPVRVKVPGEMILLPWLQQIQEQQSEMLLYEHSPLVEVQKWSDVPRGLQLFNSVVIFENFPVEQSRERSDDIKAHRPALFERTNYPLTLVIEPGPELMIQLLYDRRRFDRETITRMLDHFTALIEDMLLDPAKKLSGFSVATEKERAQLLDSFNANLEVLI
ncbi:MAG TPA: condensation domain-containing protein [Pyrinomonadaceae bacterium]|nr:condensation domain-containing protein [Pyrinomonadaceae bacterium]